MTPVGLSVGISVFLGHKVGRLVGDSCGVISRLVGDSCGVISKRLFFLFNTSLGMVDLSGDNVG